MNGPGPRASIACLVLLAAAACGEEQGPPLSLHEAAAQGVVVQVETLLDRGIDPDLADREGDLPLHHAARGGHIEVARLLLDRGASVDGVRQYGRTPLHVAGRGVQAELFALLL